MAKQISITCDAKVQLHAAKAFSSVLNEMQINHAVIGGFALSLFGSTRHTEDVDILVDLAPNTIRRFFTPTNYTSQSAFRGARAQILLCAHACGRSGSVEELVLINKGNVLIGNRETLATKTLELPGRD